MKIDLDIFRESGLLIDDVIRPPAEALFAWRKARRKRKAGLIAGGVVFCIVAVLVVSFLAKERVEREVSPAQRTESGLPTTRESIEELKAIPTGEIEASLINDVSWSEDGGKVVVRLEMEKKAEYELKEEGGRVKVCLKNVFWPPLETEKNPQNELLDRLIIRQDSPASACLTLDLKPGVKCTVDSGNDYLALELEPGQQL